MVGEDEYETMQDTQEFAAIYDEDPSMTTQIPEADTQSVNTTVTPTQVERGSPSREWAVQRMTHVELADWMEQMGASPETLEALQLHNMDGAELAYCLNPKREKEDIEIIVDQLKMEGSPITRMRIMSRIEGEVTQEEEEKKEREEERNEKSHERKQERNASQARDTTQDAVFKKYQEQIDDLKEQLHKKEDIAYGRVAVKMPRTPEVKNVVDGLSGDAWTKFGVGTVAFASQGDVKLGEMYEEIMQDPRKDARKLLDTMTKEQRKLDQVMFMSMNENATKNIMLFI